MESVSPRRARRHRRVLVALAAAALVATVSLLLPWLYGPLEFRGGGAGPAAGEAPKATWQRTLGPRGVDTMVVDARDGGTFAFAFDVANTGRLALTFSEHEPDDRVGLSLADVQITRDASTAYGGGREEWIPVDGAVVEPGQHRTLRVTLRHDVCLGGQDSRGTFVGLSEVELRYGVGPLKWTQELELPFDVVLACDELPSESR